MNESIQFAEWLADNHFRLVNVDNGVYYWVSDSYGRLNYTTLDLFTKFKNELIG